MATRQGKFDPAARPRKSTGYNKVRPGSDVSDKANKRWWRLAQAGIDDTFPVDKKRELDDAIKAWKAERKPPAMSATKIKRKR